MFFVILTKEESLEYIKGDSSYCFAAFRMTK
jgi:hypothetical protein